MLTQERYRLILELLNERNAVTVTELAQYTNISESTIRRDLNALDKEGRLKKVFGGAVSLKQIEGINEPPAADRDRLMPDEKELIACYAAGLIRDDDFVYIDSGSTTLRLVGQIGSTRALFVTNGIVHAQRLLAKGLKTIMLGGALKQKNACVTGSEGVRSLERFHFTKAFIGTNGIEQDAGFTTPDSDEAAVKEMAVKCSFASFVLADHTKFGKIYPVTFSPLSKCSIITDKLTNSGIADKTVIKEVSL
ncbi:MAG: DeoR/GlpR transcriptional regulator [Clostridia bacterium]|nr:DeoR/GlpR transcriptional regulator [Clostridia bacterium]